MPATVEHFAYLMAECRLLSAVLHKCIVHDDGTLFPYGDINFPVKVGGVPTHILICGRCIGAPLLVGSPLLPDDTYTVLTDSLFRFAAA